MSGGGFLNFFIMCCFRAALLCVGCVSCVARSLHLYVLLKACALELFLLLVVASIV